MLLTFKVLSHLKGDIIIPQSVFLPRAYNEMYLIFNIVPTSFLVDETNFNKTFIINILS